MYNIDTRSPISKWTKGPRSMMRGIGNLYPPVIKQHSTWKSSANNWIPINGKIIYK